jgi:hypothetical protein
MTRHKFHVGESIQLITGSLNRWAPEGEYRIVQQMPEVFGEFYYRIKSVHEPYQRVAKESQLRRASVGA